MCALHSFANTAPVSSPYGAVGQSRRMSTLVHLGPVACLYLTANSPFATAAATAARQQQQGQQRVGIACRRLHSLCCSAELRLGALPRSATFSTEQSVHMKTLSDRCDLLPEVTAHPGIDLSIKKIPHSVAQMCSHISMRAVLQNPLGGGQLLHMLLPVCTWDQDNACAVSSMQQ